MQIQHEATYKLGTNKGRRRLWLQGEPLRQANFRAKLDRYRRQYMPGSDSTPRKLLLCRVREDEASVPGLRTFKVSGKGDQPIIDIQDQQISDFFEGVERVRVAFYFDHIVITPEAS